MTVTVLDVYEFLNSCFPAETACDFDNAGLLVGDAEAEVKKALIALDCTAAAVRKAVSEGCNLLITHHPVIFSPIKNVLAGSLVYELVKNGISVISMHTNMDMGGGGVNDCLCRALGLADVAPQPDKDGYILKGGNIKAVSADSFAKKIKDALGGTVKYADGGRKIEKVLVCSGSGGEFAETAKSKGFDALVTAEVKHHQFLQAAESGISIFDAGHFETEDVVVEPLKELLCSRFSDVDFLTYHKTYIKSI